VRDDEFDFDDDTGLMEGASAGGPRRSLDAGRGIVGERPAELRGGGTDRRPQRADRGPLRVGGPARHEDRAVQGALGRVAHGHSRVRLDADQLGQQRDGAPAGHERKARDAVVRAVAQVGIEAAELAAGPYDDLLPAGAGVAGCPGLVRELGQRHGAAPAPRGRVLLG
jgi:hypothetical protein